MNGKKQNLEGNKMLTQREKDIIEEFRMIRPGAWINDRTNAYVSINEDSGKTFRAFYVRKPFEPIGIKFHTAQSAMLAIAAHGGV
jgi:hypothetical protein